MSRENVDVIRRLYESGFPLDPGSFESIDPEIELHPDPEAFWVGVNRMYRGHDGLREYMGAVLDAFEDYRPEVAQFIDLDDKVVTLAIEHGRGRGSGAEVQSARTAHVWTMRNGKPIRLDLYIDRERALRAVGLSE
jgi:ketosteroid isomerase-like protein